MCNEMLRCVLPMELLFTIFPLSIYLSYHKSSNDLTSELLPSWLVNLFLAGEGGIHLPAREGFTPRRGRGSLPG